MSSMSFSIRIVDRAGNGMFNCDVSVRRYDLGRILSQVWRGYTDSEGWAEIEVDGEEEFSFQEICVVRGVNTLLEEECDVLVSDGDRVSFTVDW